MRHLHQVRAQQGEHSVPASTAVVRLPQPGGYLAQLDGLRALAVTLVVSVHCVIVPRSGVGAWALRNTLSNGWIGVDLFFALSGYLITSILLRTKSRPHYFRNFYAHRFLRIFPLYYALLAILWLVAPYLPFGPFRPAWPYFTYTSNLHEVFTGTEWPLLGHAWSLAIEEQFYLLYPAVVLLLSRKSLTRLLWLIVAVSPVVRVITNALVRPGATYFATFCRLDVLAMGGLIALTFGEREHLHVETIRRLKIALFCLSATCALLWVTKQLDFKKTLFNAVGLSIVDCALSLVLVLTLCGAPTVARLLSNRHMVRLGKISYGIYLLHFPTAQIAHRFFEGRLPDGWARTGAIAVSSIGATLMLAMVSWRCFERPLLGLKKHFAVTGADEVRVDIKPFYGDPEKQLQPESHLPAPRPERIRP